MKGTAVRLVAVEVYGIAIVGSWLLKALPLSILPPLPKALLTIVLIEKWAQAYASHTHERFYSITPIATFMLMAMASNHRCSILKKGLSKTCFYIKWPRCLAFISRCICIKAKPNNWLLFIWQNLYGYLSRHVLQLVITVHLSLTIWCRSWAL